jgi:mevalonate kinase
MLIELSAPSKTFLLGEYVALFGGPAIILTTEPRFKLIVSQKSPSSRSKTVITAQSTVDKLLKQEAELFAKYHIQFVDPHHAKGGFGASSAEFLLIAALKKYLLKEPLNDVDLLQQFRRLAYEGRGLPPSGADLMAQLHGQICYFGAKQQQIVTLAWPFANLCYCLIHTGNKLATHIHLQTLHSVDVSKLEHITWQGWASLQASDSTGFINAINNYAENLLSQNLVSQYTQSLLQELTACPRIVAAKGCGAMGADVILVIYQHEYAQELLHWLKNKQLFISAYGQHAANGLEICKSSTIK